MKKITITTWYEIQNEEGDMRKLTAITSLEIREAGDLETALDINQEKVGSIERKILNENYDKTH